MKPEFYRVLVRSTGVHLTVVFMLILVPLIARLIHRKPPEQITFVEFQTLASPAVAPAPPAPAPEPAPVPEPEAPIPEKAPKPVKKKKKIEISNKRVFRGEKPPPAPNLDEIRRRLDSTPAPTTAAASSDMAWYYALVREAYYSRWQQPGGLSAMDGLSVMAEIVVTREGRVSSHRIIRTSGNARMDSSVQQVLGVVTQLKPLPIKMPGSTKTIQILFELTGAAAL